MIFVEKVAAFTNSQRLAFLVLFFLHHLEGLPPTLLESGTIEKVNQDIRGEPTNSMSILSSKIH